MVLWRGTFSLVNQEATPAYTTWLVPSIALRTARNFVHVTSARGPCQWSLYCCSITGLPLPVFRYTAD